MTIDLDDLERKALAGTVDEWQWRPGDLGVLEGKHDGQVVMFCNQDAGDTDEPALIVSTSDKAHIAANGPRVTLALIERIRTAERERDAMLAAPRKLAPNWRDTSGSATSIDAINDGCEAVTLAVEAIDAPTAGLTP